MNFLATIRRSLTALVIASVVLACLAASAAADTSQCTPQPLSQPFLPWGDASYYVEVPGQVPDGFTGQGWTLSGGAQIVPRALADGRAGEVLTLPRGARAVSPTFCVNSSYLTARAMVRNVAGADGVSFDVSYAGTPTWKTPKNTGHMHGSGIAWTLSGKLKMQPNDEPGWQLVRVMLVGGDEVSDSTVYNLYVDPYSKG